MAFQVVQEIKFPKVEYHYDHEGDVLFVSFGPSVPAIALQVEDWLALHVGLNPPFLQGMTIVGFKRVFEKINRYVEQELPERIQKIANLSIRITYDDETDILMVSYKERLSFLKQIWNVLARSKSQASIFEPLVENVYVEKSLPSKELIGFKILEYTKCGESAIEDLFGTIIDTIFEEQQRYNENAHLVTDTLIRYLDQKKLALLMV